MTIKIEFPADRQDLAATFSKALAEIAGGTVSYEVNVGRAEPEKPAKPETAPSIFDKPVTTETQTESEPDSRVDLHGVPFNPEFCGESKDPYYATGKQQGQWKKKRGVDEEAYNAWYQSELDAANPTPVQADEEPEVDTAGAFGGSAPQEQQEPAEEQLIEDGAKLMHHIAELQAQNVLDQSVVQQAYQNAKVDVMSLFPSVDNANADTIRGNVRRVHRELKALTNGAA